MTDISTPILKNDLPPPFAMPIRLPRLIYLNGPSNCGKDELAAHLETLDTAISVYYHAKPIWEMIDAFMVNLNSEIDPLDFTSNSVLNSPVINLPEFDVSKTVNWKLMLAQQTNLITQSFSPTILSYLAKQEAQTLFAHGRETVIFPQITSGNDLAFLSELCPARDQILIRVDGEGDFSWENESGNYLFPEIPSITITRKGDIKEFINTAVAFLTE